MNYKYAFFTTLLVSGIIAMALRTASPQEKPGPQPTATRFMSWRPIRWMAK